MYQANAAKSGLVRGGMNTKVRKRHHSPASAGSGMKRQRSRLLRLAPARYRRKVKDVLVGGRYDYNKKV